MLPIWLRNLFSGRRNRTRTERRPLSRPTLVGLEDRSVPASFVQNAGNLDLVLDQANETATVVSNGATYTLTLNGANVWAGTDDAGKVTGKDTGTLTVTADVFATINVDDGAAGTAAAFADSGANAYADAFDVDLGGGSAGISFAGASTFGANGLTVSTDRNITVSVGAAVSTTSGSITFAANQQAVPTGGNFQGILVGGDVTSTTGPITLTGRGGDTGDLNAGVAIGFGGSVATTGSGAVTLTGTGGLSTGDFNYGVLLQDPGTVVQTGGGAITITGSGAGTGGSSVNDGVSIVGGPQVTAGGSGAVTVTGTGGIGADTGGVYVDGAGGVPSVIASSGGAVTITGSNATASDIETFDGGRITSGGNAPLTLIGNSMSFAGANTVSAGAGTVTLRPLTAGTAIDLGGPDAAGILGLSDDDLDAVTAGTLQVGSAAAGALTVTSAISVTAAANLTLMSGTDIAVNAPASGGGIAAQAGNTFTLAATATLTATGTAAVEVDTIGATDGAGGTLTVNGDINSAGGTTLTGGADADTVTINFALTTPATVNTNAGADTVNVLASSTTGPLTINTGSELDAVNIGNSGTIGVPGKLTPVAGLITVDGGTQGANLTVDGSGVALDADYAISGTQVTRSNPVGFGGVTYSSLSTLLLTVGGGKNVVSVTDTAVPTTVNTNAGIDTVNVTKTSVAGPLTIDTGSDLDAVNVGNDGTVGSTGNLTKVAGAVTVDGGAGGTTLVVDGSGAAVAANYAISGTQVTRSTPPGFGGVTYANLTSLLLTVGSGKNVVDVTATSVPTTVNTNAGNDTVNVTAAGLAAALTVDTGSEDDLVTLTAVPAVAVTIDGGAGTDALDYSAFVTAVVVDLTAGTATGTAGVAGFENVTGGSAGDTLTGNASANVLSGLGGVDVLVGGAGNDTITGGTGADTFAGGDDDDLLIWNNGDGSDAIDGNGGTDTVQVNGNDTADEVFRVAANGARVAFNRVSPGPFSLDIGTAETLTVNALGGNDTLNVPLLVGEDLPIAVNFNGGAGSDKVALTGVDQTAFIDLTPTVGDPGAGSVLIGSFKALAFAGTENVDVIDFASSNLSLVGGNDDVTFQAGTLATDGTPALKVSGKTAGTAFSTVAYQGTNVVQLFTDLDVTGDDNVQFLATGNASGVLSIIVNESSGADTLAVSGKVELDGGLEAFAETINVNGELAVGFAVLNARGAIAQTVASTLTGQLSLRAGTSVTVSAAQTASNIVLAGDTDVTVSANLTSTGGDVTVIAGDSFTATGVTLTAPSAFIVSLSVDTDVTPADPEGGTVNLLGTEIVGAAGRLFGGPQADTFTLSRTTADIDFTAGDPPVSPGDTLVLDGGKVNSVTFGDGTLSLGGGTIKTASIEDFVLQNLGGMVTVLGTDGDDVIVVEAAAGKPSVLVNDVRTFLPDGTTDLIVSSGKGKDFITLRPLPVPLASLTVDGGEGSDIVSVVLLTAADEFPSQLITYADTGATGTDALAVTGAGQTASIDLAGDKSGTVVVGGSSLTFSGLEPVDIVGMASVTVTFADTDDEVTVEQGTTVLEGKAALTVSGKTNGGDFERVNLRNNVAVVIRTDDAIGNDKIVLNATGNQHGNFSLTVVTADGDDTLTISGKQEFLADLTVEATTVAVNANLSVVNATLTARGTLDLNASATMTGTLTLTADGKLTVAADQSAIAGITVTGFTDVVVAGSLTTQGDLVIQAGDNLTLGAGKAVVVQSDNKALVLTIDQIGADDAAGGTADLTGADLKATVGPVTLTGGDQDDTFVLSATSARVLVDGGKGTNTLKVNAQGGTFAVDGNRFIANGGGGAIAQNIATVFLKNAAQPASLVVTGTPGDDTLTVQRDATGPNFKLNAGPVVYFTDVPMDGTTALTLFTFNGTAGNDALRLLFTGTQSLTDLGVKAAKFDGGGQPGDRLFVRGGNTQDVQLVQSTTTAGAGSATINGQTLDFTNIAAVDVVAAKTVGVAFGGGGVTATVDAGTDFGGLGKASILVRPAGGTNFVPVAVWKSGSLTVDTGTKAGVDAISVTGTGPATGGHGIGDLVIVTGAEAGDSVGVSGAVAVINDLTITTGGSITTTAAGTLSSDGSDINLSAGGPVSLGGTVSAPDTATILGAKTVTITATVTGQNVSVTTTGAAGDDQSITVTGASLIATAGNVTVSSGDNLTVTGGVLRASGVLTLSIDTDSDVGGVADLVAADLQATDALLSGGNQADIFRVSLFTSKLTVDGNDPTTAPGDTLVLDLQDKFTFTDANPVFTLNDPANGTSGGPITAIDIETVSPINPGEITVVGGAGNDTLVYETDPVTGRPRYTLFTDGVLVMQVVLDRLPVTFTFLGNGGDDVLVVNLKAGEKLLTLSRIVYDGGVVGNDSLRIVGDGQLLYARLAANGSAGPDGQIRIGSPTSTPVLTFDGLEPVDVSGMALVSLTFAGADDEITVAAGKLSDNSKDAIVVSGMTGGGAFEQFNLFDIDSIVIDTTTVAGKDKVTVSGTGDKTLHQNGTLVIGTGADDAGDLVQVTGPVSLFGDFTVAGLNGTTPTEASGATTITLAATTLKAVNVTLRSAGDTLSAATITADAAALFIAGGKLENATTTAGTSLRFDAVGTITSGTATATAGDLRLEADGKLTSGTATAGGKVELVSGQGVFSTTAMANGGDVVVNGITDSDTGTTVSKTGAVSLSVTSGTLKSASVTAVTKATLFGVNGVDSGTVTVSAGPATITSIAGGVTSGTVITTGGDVTITANGTLTSKDVQANGASATLTANGLVATTGITAADQSLTITSNAGGVTNTGAASAGTTLLISAQTNVVSNKLVAGGLLGVDAKTGSVLTTGPTVGNLTKITAATAVTLNGPVSGTTGLTVVAGGAVTTGPAGTLTAGAGFVSVSGLAVTLGANVSGDSGVVVGAGPDNVAPGQNIVATNVTIASANGPITLSAADDLDLTGATLTAPNGAVALFVNTGSTDGAGGVARLATLGGKTTTITAKSATLTGSGFADIFLIDAGYDTPLAIDGVATGDNDTLRVSGKTVTVSDTTVGSGGKTVTYTNIELVALDGAEEKANAAANVTVFGGAGKDRIVVTRNSGGPFIFDDGVPIFAPGLTDLTVLGNGGDDVIRFESLGVGSPFPAGVTKVDGGAGTNTVAVVNFVPLDVTYTADATTPFAGKLLVGKQTPTLTNVQQLDIARAAKVTLLYGGTADVLTVTGGKDFSDAAITAVQVTGTTGGVAVTKVAVSNSTSLVIDTTTADGADTITFNGTVADDKFGSIVRDLMVITGAGADLVGQTGTLALRGDLTVTTGGSLSVQGAITAGGSATATAGSKITVSVGAVLTAAGPVNLSNPDAAGDQSFLVAGTVASTAGAVTLLAGDDLVVPGTVSSAKPATFAIDFQNADAGTGATADFRGATFTAPTGSTLTGNGDADTFLFTPLASDLMVAGRNPVTAPGDTLTFDAGGFGVVSGPGSFQSTGPNGGVLTYIEIETVNLKNATAATTVNGSADGDRLTIARTDGGNFFYQFDGQTAVVYTTDPASFTFNGLAGSDTLIVQYAPSDPVPVGGVVFDGGADADVGICILGTGKQAVVYAPSSASAGVVTVDGKTISFANLDATSQIDITRTQTLDLNFDGAETAVNVAEGFDATDPSMTIAALVVSGPAFVAAGVYGNANLRVNALAAGSTVTVLSAANDHKNVNLAITARAAAGDQIVFNDDAMVSGNLTLDGSKVNVRDGANLTAGGAIAVSAGSTRLESVVLRAGTTFTQTGPVLVADKAAVTVVAGTSATFNGTIDGETGAPFGGLSVNTPGQTLFGGSVGGTTPLASLTTDTAGTTLFNGAVLKTSGAITLNDPVTYSVNGFAVTGGRGILFGKTLDGTKGDLDITLTAAGQSIRFNGAVGSVTAPGAITVTSADTVTFAGTLTARSFTQQAGTGATTFDKAVNLTGDGLTVATTGAVTASSTVTVGGTITLTGVGPVVFAGETKATGLVITGGTATVTFSAPVTLLTGGAKVTANGTVAFQGPLSVTGGGVTVLSQSGEAQFAGTVTITGPVGLSVRAAGDVSFQQTVSVQNGGATVTSDTGSVAFGGTLTITGSAGLAVTAGRKVDFQKAVSVAAGGATVTSTTATKTDGAVTFADALTILAGNLSVTTKGNVTLNDVTGATAVAAGTVTIDDAADVTLDGPVTTIKFTQTDGTGTTTVNQLLTVTGTGRASVTDTPTRPDAAVYLDTAGVALNAPVSAVNGDFAVGNVNPTATGDAYIKSALVRGISQDSKAPLDVQRVFVAGGGDVKLTAPANRTRANDGKTGDGSFQSAGELFVYLQSGNILYCETNPAAATDKRFDTLGLRFEDESTAGQRFPAIRTVGGNVVLTVGGDFAAIAPADKSIAQDGRSGQFNKALPLVDTGTGKVEVFVGVDRGTFIDTGAETNVVFQAEVRAASLTLGTDLTADDKDDPKRRRNIARDTFLVSPSQNTPITVNGNSPRRNETGFTIGDQLNPDITNINSIQLDPNAADMSGDSGTFSFPGTNFNTLTFTSIEQAGGRSVEAVVIQTGPTSKTGLFGFVVRVQATQSTSPGKSATPFPGKLQTAGLPENSFIVAPSRDDPNAPPTRPDIAVGDVNGDGLADIIIAGGPGTAPLVTVIDGAALFNGGTIDLNSIQPGSGQLLAQFFAYEPDFFGGVNVAVGDFNRDGRAEIVTGTGDGGGQRVRVFAFTGLRNQAAQDKIEFNPTLSADAAKLVGAAKLTFNPLNNVVQLDQAVALNQEVSQIKVAFDIDFVRERSNFFAFDRNPLFRGGVNVSAGDIDGDGKTDLVVGAGNGGGPRVDVYAGKGGGVLRSFFAYESTFRGGVLVDAGFVDDNKFADIVTAPGVGGGAIIHVYFGGTAGQSSATPTPNLVLPINPFTGDPLSADDPTIRTGLAAIGLGAGTTPTGNGRRRSILAVPQQGSASRVYRYNPVDTNPDPEVETIVLTPQGDILQPDSSVFNPGFPDGSLTDGGSVGGFSVANP